MAIKLHSFVTSCKRYIQVESLPLHITGILRKMIDLISLRGCDIIDIHNAYYYCEEDGTVTFYQADKAEVDHPGIWTYMLYECPEGQEKVFRDSNIDTSLKPLYRLLAGDKLVQETVDINQYLQYRYQEGEYLDVQLPPEWNNQEGRKIANLLFREYQVFKKSAIFAETAGENYMQTVMKKFIQAATSILEAGGNSIEFEYIQHEILKQVKIDDIANLILDLNDYRIWQALLPSESKAVEYAFNTALSRIA
ncbi:hypothetical protein NIES4071_78100 [Calothrix sp. NIES-4071]|nr:hypothetical protein NIES4071_78100 [Calothrix sp. NIES-4071]BAZ62083.1 hypothetical protein NIES4105_78040 [Calothrix sp. NIES-4105]